ncbi:MAG: ATP-binding protein [Clostridia bacterium]
MKLNEALSRINYWWSKNEIKLFSNYKIARNELDLIKKSLSTKRILSIIGPRRVGKSTLIYQTIEYLLKEKIDNKRIMFFSGDDPSIFSENVSIGDIIELYLNEILHENIQELKEKVYIFIDEIHVVKDWQVWLKSYYDKNYNIKFIISGSSSTHLFEGSKESLLGRYDSIKIMPLLFIEYCKFYSIYNNDEKISEFLNELPNFSTFDNIEKYYTFLKENELKLNYYKPYVNKVLDEYLLIGGYPEYFEVNDIKLWQKRLVEDIIGQGLYRDIISIFNIKNPNMLEKLIYFITANIGQTFNYKTIADTIGADNETVQNYISFLSTAYLVIILENYSTNIGKSIRKNKKLYVLDNGISNALLHLEKIDSTRKGNLIETLCVRNVLNICENNFWKMYYWNNNNNEVDIVIDKNDKIILVKINNENNLTNYEKAILEFKKTFNNKYVNVESLLLITKDDLSFKNNIYAIPFWLVN